MTRTLTLQAGETESFEEKYNRVRIAKIIVEPSGNSPINGATVTIEVDDGTGYTEKDGSPFSTTGGESKTVIVPEPEQSMKVSVQNDDGKRSSVDVNVVPITDPTEAVAQLMEHTLLTQTTKDLTVETLEDEQGNTKTGGFVADIGAGGRASPIQSTTLSAPAPSVERMGVYQRNYLDDYFQRTYSQTSNAIAIQNTPVGGSLSGIYRIDTGYALSTAFTNEILAMTTLGSTTTSAQFSVTGARPGRFKFTARHPSFGSTVNSNVINWSISLVNVSAQYFSTYVNTGMNLGVANNEIPPGTSRSNSHSFALQPMFSYITVNSAGVPRYNPFIGTTNTTFTVNLGIDAPTGLSMTSGVFQMGFSMAYLDYMSNAIYDTIQSYLPGN